MVDYTGHFITCVVVVHSVLSKTIVLQLQKLKQPKFLDVNSRLNQNMSKLMINYESVSTRPCFRLSPVPDPSSLYSYDQ